jgi:hypothetical protein
MHRVVNGEKVYGMARSENRRPFHNTAANRRPTCKTSVGGNKGGKSGSKHRKHHANCMVAPGRPGGMCLKRAITVDRVKHARAKCECTRCLNAANPPKPKVMTA